MVFRDNDSFAVDSEDSTVDKTFAEAPLTGSLYRSDAFTAASRAFKDYEPLFGVVATTVSAGTLAKQQVRFYAARFDAQHRFE